MAKVKCPNCGSKVNHVFAGATTDEYICKKCGAQFIIDNNGYTWFL
jgi:DNA-directed RNA polymerase subunit RPC12/RpoP